VTREEWERMAQEERERERAERPTTQRGKVLPFAPPDPPLRAGEPLVMADEIAWDIDEWNRRYPSGSQVAMAWAALSRAAKVEKEEV